MANVSDTTSSTLLFGALELVSPEALMDIVFCCFVLQLLLLHGIPRKLA